MSALPRPDTEPICGLGYASGDTMLRCTLLAGHRGDHGEAPVAAVRCPATTTIEVLSTSGHAHTSTLYCARWEAHGGVHRSGQAEWV